MADHDVAGTQRRDLGQARADDPPLRQRPEFVRRGDTRGDHGSKAGCAEPAGDRAEDIGSRGQEASERNVRPRRLAPGLEAVELRVARLVPDARADECRPGRDPAGGEAGRVVDERAERGGLGQRVFDGPRMRSQPEQRVVEVPGERHGGAATQCVQSRELLPLHESRRPVGGVAERHSGGRQLARMAGQERREGDVERPEGEGGAEGELVGEDDCRLEVVDDLGQACGDALRLPQQVVEPSSGLKLERRHHPLACRGQELIEARVVAARLGRGIAACSQPELHVPEAVGEHPLAEAVARREHDLVTIVAQRGADCRHRQVVRDVVRADEERRHAA